MVPSKSEVMAAVAQSFLIVVFVGAAVAKLSDRARFFRSLSSIPWLDVRLARRLAVSVPITELGVVAALLIVPRIGAVAAACALLAFAGVVLIELAAGREFRCGCFGGVDAQPAGSVTVGRNLALAAVSFVLFLRPYSFELGAVLVGAGLGFTFLIAEVGADTVRSARLS